MMTNCPVCGKLTCIFWPEHWVYRRGDAWLCSENCMIVFDTMVFREKCGWKDRKKGSRTMANHKLTLEQKKKAVEIYESGGDYLAWLKKCGAKNPSAAWLYIRQKMMGQVTVVPHDDIEKAANYPEKNEPKTAGEAMQNMQDAADAFFDQCKEAGLKLDGPKQEEPEDDFECSVIRSKKTGARYEMFEGSLCMKIGTDEFVLDLDTWRELMREIPKAAGRLGVTL